MTRSELIEAIAEATFTPEQKQRRKKWAKKVGIGVGAVAGVYGVHKLDSYFRNCHRSYTPRNKISDIISDLKHKE